MIFSQPLSRQETPPLSKYILLTAFCISLIFNSLASDTLNFKGQVSAYGHFNPSNDMPVWVGGRYIPQLNYGKSLLQGELLDFEVSANFYGNLGSDPFRKFENDGKIKPYRAWTRFSDRHYELRLGLQKINFGSAMLLRPLMWFDQVDPRDPLQLTDGVWGLLGRYYFMYNTNFWIWGLWGNQQLKMWETTKTNQSWPELGGRMQSPLLSGDAALSYHFRMSESSIGDASGSDPDNAAEHRFGIDGKWDVGVGLWFEAVWIRKNKNLGDQTNQQIINLGLDYTLAIGHGLNVVFEQLLYAEEQKPFAFSNQIWFSALAATYPVTLFDNLQAVFYFDWLNTDAYNFLNWKKQLNKFDINIMAWWNPKNYHLPSQQTGRMLFGGKGLQVMVVYNH